MHYIDLFKVFLILGVISLLLDWYVYSGLVTLTSGWKSALIQNLVIFGYLVVSAGITIVFISGYNSFRTAQGMLPFHEYMLSFFITLLITKLFFVIVLGLGDLVRLLYGIGDGVFGKKHTIGQPFFPAGANLSANWRC